MTDHDQECDMPDMCTVHGLPSYDDEPCEGCMADAADVPAPVPRRMSLALGSVGIMLAMVTAGLVLPPSVEDDDGG